jgi:hypothetical protein
MGSHVLGPFVVIGNQIYLGNLGSFALGSVVS